MISQADKKRFRAISHHLKPIVTIAGKGLTDNVMKEIERALFDHELIKIKVNVGDREARDQVIATICEDANCLLVHAIGNVAVLYRKAAKPDPAKSNLLRTDIL